MKIKAKVIECVKKSFEGRDYYVLLVEPDGSPIGKVSSPRPYEVGSYCELSITRRESDMRLILRVQ